MDFSDEERLAVYRAIEQRRDVRQDFLPEPLDEDALSRILGAAWQAPSVGFMQPSRFVLVHDRDTREEVKRLFQAANEEAARSYRGKRRELYDSLRLEAILEAPLNICVACDTSTSRGHGLGRQSAPETALYSTVCAIQNLWLAARVEGVGIGWVSILDHASLAKLLHLPRTVKPVAYLCAGYVSRFRQEPELEARGWERRADAGAFIHVDRYDPSCLDRSP